MRIIYRDGWSHIYPVGHKLLVSRGGEVWLQGSTSRARFLCHLKEIREVCAL